MENPAEVQELRNKLRMMKFPQDDILNTVRRQQRAIHKQRQANDTIRNEIEQYEAQIQALSLLKEQHKADHGLEVLQATKKTLSNKLSILSADYQAEEAKRHRLEEAVSRANSKAGGLFQQSRENQEMQRQVRTTENRLDKALVRYSKNLTTLADLRSQLDELRKDRANFRQVMKGASQTGEHKDQEIAALIRTSNAAYSERDRKKMDLVRLKGAEETDRKVYDDKIQRLTQTIAGQKIAQTRQVNQPVQQASMDGAAGQAADQQEELTRLTEEYNDTIQRTLSLLQLKDVPELFSEADRLERENFSLFNYVVEHGAQRTRLQEEIDGLDMQRQTLLAQADFTDQEQSTELAKITQKIGEVDSELTCIQDQQTKNATAFTSVYAEIETLFNMLECKWDQSPDGNTSITAANAMFCLSLIEVSIADCMGTLFETVKRECAFKDIRPANLIVEAPPVEAPAGIRPSITAKPGMVALSQDKELAGRVADSTHPMSLDELRAMLE
jgi:chromosome segregation ATPase